ncbi:restriction endonuclease subunit S [Enterococcus faecalis]|uniref:restriction endonuclease subunit S n=1 Tax=Enterococcus faecalis TaxID=1351 RepID=UPI00115897A9|nr:restriction endonuclease subunit S [Enterococcus faecalis]MDU5019348.1 restriction endonuclease subunit S [Clostridiales bacterium]EHB6445608.1 restriction endonuclease subunit S [Enterococcus faecalis]EKN1390205.1 restriction endonuclease subunit S [Enterococcus faecalis]UYY54039.1 restriction endonuclease subunit S [Enterococcus faecalis]HCR3320354.1 restriction endonuclease subunit S [Enterococcus faecalis]
MSKKSPQLRFKGFTDDWEERKLGEVGYFYYGKSAPKWSVTEDAETPCVRYGELYTKYGAKISNIYSHTNINPKNLKFSTGNEVLVPRVGENPLDFSLCSWLSIPNVAIGEMISVYNTNENPLFISYYFRSQMKYEFAKRVEGGNVSNLYYSYLEDIDLYIPKLEEQIAISKFFEKLDDTIALHQRKLDLLKEQKKGYLQKMFPKNGAKVPELRFAGFADDWEERKLKDVVEKQIKGKAQFEKLAQGDVEYLDTSRLNGGQAILTNGLKDVTLDDILILWDGSKAGTVYHGFEGALGSTLKAYRTSANSKFVYQYLKRHQDNIYNNYRTPNIPHVQKDFLNVFTISVPGSDEQAKIGSFFKKLDDTIALHQRKLDLLKEQKKGFLQKMFV